MSASSSRAVFLSYASEDAPVVRRICDSLRSAGIEVWFDQSELVGGDAWDGKIRGQIATCRLFVPVISARTQARLEGYFRLEWKLAAQRTHTMADELTFLLPVVIDDTSDADARVPAEFRAVQWTRLPGGDTTPAFVARIQEILAGQTPARPAATPAAPSLPAPRTARRTPVVFAAALVGALALGAAAWLYLGRTPTPAAPVAAPPPAPAVSDKSIAVLPFENRSADGDGTVFSDGVHEEILTQLTQVRELRVVSRTSVMEYRGTKKKVPQIARELGVAYLLEGSVQRMGAKVRITGQLVRAATDENVWARSFDRDATDVFAIQSDIARAIAEALKAALSPREQLLLNQPPTRNLAAYDLYLKSRAIVNAGLRVRSDFERRVTLLQSALELDPEFAHAWADLAEAHAGIIVASLDATPARLAKATAAIDRAYKLAPDSPTVIRSRGVYFLFGVGDGSQATALFERLITLQPNDAEAHHWLGLAHFGKGDWRRALEHRHRAYELDPANAGFANGVGVTLMALRRYDEARTFWQALTKHRGNPASAEEPAAAFEFRASANLAPLQELLQRRQAADPDSPGIIGLRKALARYRGDYLELIALDRRHPDVRRTFSANSPAEDIDYEPLFAAPVYLAAGDHQAARSRLGTIPEQIRARLALDPDNTILLRYGALAEAILAQRDEALRRIQHAKTVARDRPSIRIGVREFEAMVLALLGENERALHALAELLQLPSNRHVHELRHAPEFYRLHGDPRFEALLNDPRNRAPLL